MSNNWTEDKKWSDKFLNEIKRIIGENFIYEPPIEEDMSHNTDLTVLNLDAIRIACRVRKYDFFKRYPNDFTIRCSRPNNSKTELAKIIEGWGDYLFYAFANQDESHLISWHIISLKAFRLWFNREIIKNKSVPGEKINNSDNSSEFIAFNILHMPADIIFKQNNQPVCTNTS